MSDRFFGGFMWGMITGILIVVLSFVAAAEVTGVKFLPVPANSVDFDRINLCIKKKG